MKPNNKIAIAIFTLMLTAFTGFLAANAAGDLKVLQGVKIDGLDVGGLGPQEMRDKISPLEKQLLAREIIIQYGDRTWRSTYEGLGYQVLVDSSIEQALKLGREGKLLQNFWERLVVKTRGADISLPMKGDYQQAMRLLGELALEVGQPAINARRIITEDDQIFIYPDRWGWDLKEEAIFPQLERLAGYKGRSAAINLVLKPVEPQVTENELRKQRITGLLSQYSTKFDPKDVNRVENIRLAAGALSGLLVAPEAVFSFNEHVGPRNVVAGYKEAPVIIQGELQPGLGGGVCQVSTTLYNVALRGDLEIVERSNHSRPVGYVPLGTDATVSYGYLDLKFKNNASGYLLLRSKVAANLLTIKIYGNVEELPGQVDITAERLEVLEPEVEVIEDSSLKPGETVVDQEGRKGFRTMVKRTVRRGQELIKEEVISEDLYRPEKRVMRVGKEYQEGALRTEEELSTLVTEGKTGN